MANARALDGIRVIDFGQYIAGPMAAMFLADHGADVIRVDPPGGPCYDTPANATWNRGKRSIVLNLKNPGDRITAGELIATADVVIENFRPGVMDRLQLGSAAMTATHPRLIYCSLPGFGATDPRAGVRAWEGVLGAATVAYRPNAKNGTGRPIYTVTPFSSVAAAYLSAVSIAAALYARERSGVGQRIEVPLFDATFSIMSNLCLKTHNHPRIPPTFDWSRQLPTRDGRWFRYFSGNKRFEPFIKEIGMAKYRDAGLKPDELGKHFDEIFRTRTAAQWEEFCAEFGTEGATCNTSAEWLRHPQALGSGIVMEFDDPKLGKFRGPGINVRLSATPGTVRSPRPRLDEHRDQILEEISKHRPPPSSPAEVPDLRCALQGLKVLDLCMLLAGPTCGRTLAEFGAQVIKIDNPHRFKIRAHNDVNRGKRSIVLDLKSPDGLKIFWRLLDDADVVLQNFRMGVADKLGLGYEAVRARRPEIIYCSINTFGQIGPYASRPGHESIAQAISGMMERYGSNSPVLLPFSVNDYGTGLMACYAILMALLHKKRSGRGQHVDTALAYAATIVQSDLLQDFEGKKWDEPRGQEALGRHPLYRMYQASDGWLFLSARHGDLESCTRLADLADKTDAHLERALEIRFREDQVDTWVAALSRAGIGAHRVVTSATELMEDPVVRARGLSITRLHDDLGPVTTTGPGARLSRTPAVLGQRAQKPGASAEDILGEIGLRDQLDRLISERVIVVDGIEAD